ncbi:MAG TPA: hypothetical protein VNF73_01515 [Candidatus Saccharimonadales bacterium]|nr:hypothetical protein [Candidatus Saccharimonadales bacterium]
MPEDLLTRRRIPNAVLHLMNEQPLLADLIGMPGASDVTLVCTNVRSTTGKRPVWADHLESVYYFPWVHIRFLEVPPGSLEGGPELLESGEVEEELDLPDEAEIEIDEEFLRRVREV